MYVAKCILTLTAILLVGSTGPFHFSCWRHVPATRATDHVQRPLSHSRLLDVRTGAYVSNWAALNAFMANNIVGQWKRATTAAAVSACNGLGGVAGSYIVRQQEAPQYQTAVWVSVGYVLIRQLLHEA